MSALEKLKKLAHTKPNHIEVEDLIACAQDNDKTAAAFLREVSVTLGWLDKEQAVLLKQVPLAEWAEVVITYLEDGYDGLRKYKHNEKKFYYVLSLLEDLHSQDSLYLILEMFGKVFLSPTDNIELTGKVIAALNFLLSFPPKNVPIDMETEVEIRDFLHSLLKADTYPNIDSDCLFRANVYCALRGVGNKESIKLIKNFEKLTDGWEGIEKRVARAIRKRKSSS